MWNYVTGILNSDALSPHGICLLWRPELMWLHIVSDGVIGAAYFSIPVALGVLVSRRRDIEFGWVFWAFALFILACGTTHFFSIWTLFIPDYGIEGLIKAATAIFSVITAILLWPLIPKVLALPSPEQLRQANSALEVRVEERDRALRAFERERDERLHTEAKLRQAQKLEAIGQLTAGIAHDFNNLLTMIMGNLDRALRREGDPEEVRRSIAAANLSAERAAVLTERLLAFGRRQPLNPRDTDVNDLVKRSADTLQRILGEKMQVVTQLAPDLWTTFVDAGELESALLNLAINARDAMPEGGHLLLTTRNVGANETPLELADLPGEFIEVGASDDGHGMTADVLARAFEPFFSTKSPGAGSGLGLSQVYGFTQQSNGTISIDSRPGQGTVVRLYLPRSGQPSTAKPGKPSASASGFAIVGVPAQ